MVLSDEEVVECGDIACVRHLRGEGKERRRNISERRVVCDKHASILRMKYEHYVIIYKQLFNDRQLFNDAELQLFDI